MSSVIQSLASTYYLFQVLFKQVLQLPTWEPFITSVIWQQHKFICCDTIYFYVLVKILKNKDYVLFALISKLQCSVSVCLIQNHWVFLLLKALLCPCRVFAFKTVVRVHMQQQAGQWAATWQQAGSLLLGNQLTLSFPHQSAPIISSFIPHTLTLSLMTTYTNPH